MALFDRCRWVPCDQAKWKGSSEFSANRAEKSFGRFGMRACREKVFGDNVELMDDKVLGQIGQA